MNGSSPDFQLLFESVPGNYLVLNTDSQFTIVAVSQGYLQATTTTREFIVGRGLFEVFPDNPSDPSATGSANLRASLERVMKSLKPDAMAVQKYDIPVYSSQDGGFEVRYWSPVNTPVLNGDGTIKYIIHQAEDVTEFVRLKQQELEQGKETEALKSKTAKMEIEIINRSLQLQSSNEELRKIEAELRQAKYNLEQQVEIRTRELRYSENKFFLIFDNTPIAIALIEEKNAVFADVNPAFLRMFEFTKEELIGKTSIELGINQNPDARQKMIGEFLRTGMVRNRESVIQTKSGKSLIISNNLDSIELNGKKYMLATIEDVTERRKTEQALKDSEAQFRTFADSMPQLAWMANPDGFIFWYNKGWYDYTGTTPEQMEGWGWKSVHDPNEIDRVMQQWKGAIAAKEEIEFQFPLKSADGQFKWFLTRVTPIKNSDGEVVRWFGTNTNIDEQRRIQDELSRALIARDDFLAIASHELKTPITSMKLQNQIAIRDMLKGNETVYSKERTDARLILIDKQINRLERLIDDMLDFSRMRIGKFTMQKEKFKLNEVVKDVIERMGPQFFEAQAQLPVFQGCASVMVKGDRMRIEQVITNLLSNALRYGKGMPVLMKLESDSYKVKLYVKDNGMGVSEENQSRIFNRFERAVSASEVSGLGLGLFISQQIIKSHGGNISLDSVPGKGSTFIVELPLH